MFLKYAEYSSIFTAKCGNRNLVCCAVPIDFPNAEGLLFTFFARRSQYVGNVLTHSLAEIPH